MTTRMRSTESIQSADEEALEADLKLIKSGSSMIVDRDDPAEDASGSNKRRRRPSARARLSYISDYEASSEMMSRDTFLSTTRLSLAELEILHKDADELLSRYGLDDGLETSWTQLDSQAKAAACQALGSSRSSLPSFAPSWILQDAWRKRQILRQPRATTNKTTLTFRIIKPKLEYTVK